ncbi:MAG TPA: hypothetical protein VMC10_07875 [Stellaceae bacterium]|nr:hypothetical protein [Stellaceae bacterium]
MADFSQARRQLLLGTAKWVAGAGAVAAMGVSRPAEALQSYVANPGSAVGILYSDRCGPGNEHAALVAELERKLQIDPSLSPLTAMCPICGCPVTVTR